MAVDDNDLGHALRQWRDRTIPAAVGLRYPRDGELRRLIDDLITVSPRFAELWRSGAVAAHTSDRKVIDHPDVGPITLDCDLLMDHGADLRTIAYTAEPGSADAEKLALLRVIGVQSLARPG